jgi:4-alpha-glucanotransferase
MTGSNTHLHKLANLYGIKTSYFDVNGLVNTASDESLIAILKSMQSPLAGMKDIQSAIREKEQQFWHGIIDPVIVVWENEILSVNLRLPLKLFNKPVSAFLSLEDGTHEDVTWIPDETSIINTADVEGVQHISLRLYFPRKVAMGYHKLIIEYSGHTVETLVISAPLKSYLPQEYPQKIWGMFVPLYALHSQKSWGAGDFSDLERLMIWLSERGAHMVGTLPLLPSFNDNKFGPGPYMPASRLFWNDFFLNIAEIPELEWCPEAKILMGSNDFQNTLSSLRSSQMIDYRRQSDLKRKVLDTLAESFFSEKPERFFDFQLFSDSHPSLDDFASFRAAGEKHGVCWNDWPQSMQNGTLTEDNYSQEAKRYHLYTQWLAQEQIQNISLKAKENNFYLYMDLPLGVHPYSYDVWRERNSFAFGVNGGAPPDPVFTSGQNWNFPPLHPENIRKDGYRYFIKSLRHQLRQAGMLRIDHMMNFHRLFWIPEGMDNKDGVYVSYKAEELYAILTLESCRNKTIIVGEDLGMVPPEVRPMMEKHGIFRMFVGQYELISENQLGNIPVQSVASLNTHDMFPFASFWQENDILERQKLKLLNEASAKKELEARRNVKRALISILQYKGLSNEVSQDTEATLKAILGLFAASPAYAVLLNLEDLWLESHPQNIPGTQRNQNWSRKVRYSFEEFSKSPAITETLKKINQSRKGI